MKKSSKPAQTTKRCASAVLDDRTLVEQLFLPDAQQSRFVVSSDGKTRIVARHRVPSGHTLLPYSPDNNLLSHGVVLLPSAVDAPESREALSEDLRSFIHRYADLDAELEEIAAQYVFLTWIYDAFSELPYLRVRGDYGTGKTRFLLTVGSLCYKPIFASGASTTSPIFRTLDAFRGTLVLDESDFRQTDERAEITKILNNGNAAGFPVLRSEATPQKEYNPTAFHVFGPKIIATRRSFDDQALESRCITFDLTARQPRREIPLNLPPAFHEEARALRNQLLSYRFEERFRPFDLEEEIDRSLDPRISQMFAPLLVTTTDAETAARIRSAAARLSGQLASERAWSVEAHVTAVLKALLEEDAALTVKAITARFESEFGDDYLRAITPRWMGGILRKRLRLELIKSHGTFKVEAGERPKIDALIKRYGLSGGGGENDETPTGP